MLKHTKYTFQVVRHMPVPENRQMDYISGASQLRIQILVYTHIFAWVRNPVNALCSVLDHYNMLKHTKYNFKWFAMSPFPKIARLTISPVMVDHLKWLFCMFQHVVVVQYAKQCFYWIPHPRQYNMCVDTKICMLHWLAPEI